jgi:phosphoserine phosphatase
MKTAPRAAILDRIRAALAPGERGAVAFDGDGTLWSGDVGEDFFHATIRRCDYRDEASEALARVADEHGLPSEGPGVVVAGVIYDAYLAGRFPEERVCEMMAWGVAGWTVGEARAFAESILDRTKLESRFHAEAVAALRWARDAGLEVYLVSASPRAIVEAAAARLDIGADHVLAATPDVEGEVVKARPVRPIPYGPGKVHALQAKLGGRVLAAAFGDNAFDVPMLAASRVPVAVRPKQRLLDRAAEVPGLVALEPEG